MYIQIYVKFKPFSKAHANQIIFSQLKSPWKPFEKSSKYIIYAKFISAKIMNKINVCTYCQHTKAFYTARIHVNYGVLKLRKEKQRRMNNKLKPLVISKQ